MSVESHLAQLERKHQALEQAIASEMAHPHHDEAKIATMKRKKLLLKDEIAKLRPAPAKKKELH
ncbi:MAG: YdcH family protein [Albidovulum sp.]